MENEVILEGVLLPNNRRRKFKIINEKIKYKKKLFPSINTNHMLTEPIRIFTIYNLH